MNVNLMTGSLEISPKVFVKIKLEREDITLPSKAHKNDACYDICSSETLVLPPFEPVIVQTGLAFEIPNEYYLQVFSRSGLSSKGIILLNSVGIIDPNYRGYIKVPLMNLTKEEYKINCGDRIAQIGLAKLVNITWNQVQTLNMTNRGTNGFGSSGI